MLLLTCPNYFSLSQLITYFQNNSRFKSVKVHMGLDIQPYNVCKLTVVCQFLPKSFCILCQKLSLVGCLNLPKFFIFLMLLNQL